MPELLQRLLLRSSATKLHANLFQTLRLAPTQSTGSIRLKMTVLETHLNYQSRLHGGITATLVDIAGSLAIAHKTQSENTGVSTDIHVNYLSSTSINDELIIDAWCGRAGRILAFTTVEIRVGEKLVATGSHTKFIGAKIV